MGALFEGVLMVLYLVGLLAVLGMTIFCVFSLIKTRR